MNREWEKIDAELARLHRRRYQLICQTDEPSEKVESFEPVDDIVREGVKVVYQGVEGAYSHQAAREFFGREAGVTAVPTFEAAVAAIDAGEADFAVLPLENTTGGTVGDVLDLQMKYECYTVAEVDLPVRHALLGLPGATLAGVHTVYSHPQGLMQCSDFLERYRDWDRVPLSNTAASARRLNEEGDPTHAAIASEFAGELYGLTVLARGIANNRQNTTRFIIATRRKIYRKNAGKIRICFECRHATGTLYENLSNLVYNELNMTKIESRPIPGRSWEYRFFVEFEGNLRDPAVKNAIAGVRRDASLCKVLGNF